MAPKTPDEMKRAAFAARIDRLLRDKGWNQSDLARAASQYLPKGEEFRRDNVHVYINGRSLPRKKHLTALAKALGVPEDDLLPNAEGGAKHTPAFHMQSIPDEPGFAWLTVNMKVSNRKALSVLAILEDA